MEAFSLLKYWKGTAGGKTSGGGGGVNVKLPTIPTTIVTAVNHRGAAEDEDDDDASDGPFFDLEFAVPADVDEEEDDEEEEEEEMRQKVEERESVDEINEVQNMSFLPSDDLFFKGKVIQINGSDAASALEMEEILHSAAAAAAVNSKSGQFPVPVSLVKSATKLRVFMLGLKRSKSESKQIPSDIINRNKNSKKNNSKFMTVRLKLEDVKTPIISLLSRATSNTVKNTQVDEKSAAENHNTAAVETMAVETAAEEVEKKNKKEMVQKYLKLVRPLYVKVSNRKNNNHQETADEEVDTAAAAVRGGRRRLNLKVIAKKHLGKSKSAVVHSMPSSSNNSNNTTSSKKSDDSLFQQQDGIQSAILHCKRSFNSSSSSSTSEDGEDTTSVLMRSASDPSYEKKPTVVADEQQQQRNGVVEAG